MASFYIFFQDKFKGSVLIFVNLVKQINNKKMFIAIIDAFYISWNLFFITYSKMTSKLGTNCLINVKY